MDCFPKWMNMCSEGEEELCATEEQKHLFDAYYTIILKEGPLEFDIKIPKAVAQGDVDGLCKLVLHYGGGGHVSAVLLSKTYLMLGRLQVILTSLHGAKRTSRPLSTLFRYGSVSSCHCYLNTKDTLCGLTTGGVSST